MKKKFLKHLNEITFIILLLIISINFSYGQNKNDFNFPERYLGNKNAKNVLIEYASLSCVHCANFHLQEFEKIKSSFIDTGKLKFIFRDFPLDRPAMIGSMIAQCQTEERYFPIVDSIFRNQKKWVTDQNTAKAIDSILKEYGISSKKIEEC